ncbi:hypothetical protein [Sphingomonas sp. 22R3R2A-7]|uniref:hypothetical protein n=1 Tax=Sphingomonas sp. 22R3R2A-7 TaxID=3050230 RepID=UPI002FE270DC
MMILPVLVIEALTPACAEMPDAPFEIGDLDRPRIADGVVAVDRHRGPARRHDAARRDDRDVIGTTVLDGGRTHDGRALRIDHRLRGSGRGDGKRGG